MQSYFVCVQIQEQEEPNQPRLFWGWALQDKTVSPRELLSVILCLHILGHAVDSDAWQEGHV